MEQTRRIVHRMPSADMFRTSQYAAPKKVVAAYARVSTEKEEQEDSFERQVEHYTQLITSNPEWQFGGIYADPGITGTRAEKRPDFMRMIADCRAGKIDRIYVKSISRFARNTVDALNYIRELKELGIGIQFESENIDTLSTGGEVLLTILAAMAEQESRTMSTNIKWAYQKKFEKGEVMINTGTVLGYRKAASGEYEIVEEEAEIVRRIFREYVSGMSVPQIARRLEADGYKTKRGSEAWRPNAVLGILKNEKYSGNAILGKTYKPDVLSKRRIRNDGTIAPMYYAENTHPAIIPKELFDLAQDEMQRRKDEKDIAVGGSRYTSKYPFSGLLICGDCGHRLRRHVRTMGSGRKAAAWGCANRIANGRAVCDSRHVSEDVLKETYRAAIMDAVGDMDAIIETVKDSCRMVLVADNHEALAEVERQIIKLQEDVLDFHRARQGYAVTEAEYNAQIEAYTDQMQQLEARCSELQSTSNKYTAVQNWLDTFKETAATGDIYDPDNAAVMKAMVEYIVVHRDRMEIHLKCGVTVDKEYV